MANAQKAVFTTGSTMRHVVVMTATASIGLVSIFLVDAITLFYIALLGERELAAAIGYSATLLFFTISVSIGLAIAATARVAKALGGGEIEEARQLAGSSIIYILTISIVLAVALYTTLPILLSWLGAVGETKALALSFMYIVVPSLPLLGFGMCAGGLLRAKGDPRRAMYVTLSGGAAALVLDPLFIFGFGMGIDGAAVATVLVRVVLVAVGLHALVKVHNLIAVPDAASIGRHFKPFIIIAGPAVATQLATPVGNAYITAAIATHGDGAVAGWAIVGRLLPVAFGTIFALSGAVGPILSQNLGAKKLDRVRQTMRDALLFTLIYCFVAWGILALAAPLIVTIFGAQGDAALLITTFCTIVAGTFIFNGALFVANAAFNNLGFAFYATLFNWGRATLGVIPFVWLGNRLGGAEGILIGWGLGAVIFGIAAVIVAFGCINRLSDDKDEPLDNNPHSAPGSASPFTSGKGAGAGLN